MAKQQIGLLFGVSGEGHITGESGSRIKSQLQDIVNELNKSSVTKIKFQYEFDVSKVQKEIKKAIDGTNIRLASEEKINRDDILRIVKSYDLDPARYEIISGAAMVLYGYKEYTRDIDISVSDDYYLELLKKYECTYEKVTDNGECIFFIDQVLNFGRNYYSGEHTTIEGLPVQTKDNLIQLKKKLHRKKDVVELEMIK